MSSSLFFFLKVSQTALLNLTPQLHNSIQFKGAVLPSNDGTQLTLSHVVIKMYEVPAPPPPIFPSPLSLSFSSLHTITHMQPKAKHTMRFLILQHWCACVCVCVYLEAPLFHYHAAITAQPYITHEWKGGSKGWCKSERGRLRCLKRSTR